MSIPVSTIGWRPNATAGVTTPVTVNASTSLTMPTTAQRLRGFTMMCIVSLETQQARWTTNGVIPTAAIGMLMQPNSLITLMGEDEIAAFRIISVTAGAQITYQFSTADDRA